MRIRLPRATNVSIGCWHRMSPTQPLPSTCTPVRNQIRQTSHGRLRIVLGAPYYSCRPSSYHVSHSSIAPYTRTLNITDILSSTFCLWIYDSTYLYRPIIVAGLRRLAGSGARVPKMNSPTQSDYTAILKEFTNKLEECTRTAVCGRRFVLVGKFQEWLRSQATPAATHINLQVNAAYRNRSRPNLPISFNIFDATRDCCLLIFCILHMIGRGDLIHAFTEEGKVDKKLPLSPTDVESILKKENASSLAAEFTEKQHRFCPARFDFQRAANWNEDVVIPICSKNRINEGGTAHLWQIEVPEEFVEEDLRKQSSTSRFNAATSGSDPDWVRMPLQLCRTKFYFFLLFSFRA